MEMPRNSLADEELPFELVPGIQQSIWLIYIQQIGQDDDTA